MHLLLPAISAAIGGTNLSLGDLVKSSIFAYLIQGPLHAWKDSVVDTTVLSSSLFLLAGSPTDGRGLYSDYGGDLLTRAFRRHGHPKS